MKTVKTISRLLIIVILFSCEGEKAFDLNKLPNDFISLTEKNNELVIFNSCDEGNRQLKIINGKSIKLHGTQEDYFFDVKNVSIGKSGTIKIETIWSDSKEKVIYEFKWVDKKNGLVEFRIIDEEKMGVDGLFTTLKKRETYKVINQPCIECWSKEDCNETGLDKHELLEVFNIPQLNSTLGSITKFENILDTNKKIYYFNYHNQTDYGSGVLLTETDSLANEKPVWINKTKGDFPPHTVHLVDFNGDKHQDIFLLTGMEDVYTTQIYLYYPSNKTFHKTFENNECYATIIDIDSNKLPELIVGEIDDYISFRIPKSFDEKIKNEYLKITGSFIKYNEANNYGQNLFITRKYKIFNYSNNQFGDVTHKFRNHLKFRKNIIDSITYQESTNGWEDFERQELTKVSNYLDSIINIK